METDRGNTYRNIRMPGIGMLNLLLLCCLAASPTVLAGEKPYDFPPVFLCRPNVNGSAATTHVGVTGLQVKFGPNVVVSVAKTEPDTPAHGQFKEGDVLLAVNGKTFRGNNPMVVLGDAITAAEATDGKMAFTVKDGEDTAKEVTLEIPVLGAYSPTWPLNCEKSKKIIAAHAQYVIESRILKGNGIGPSLAGLFLLSTDDDQYLSAVKENILLIDPKNVGDHTWNNGYNGVLVGEYYLRTGDKSVLPVLQALCENAAERQYYSGWAHWGKMPGIGYVQGGLVNSCGAQVFTTLMLGSEAGVKVDREAANRALKFYYRFVGHGGVPYGNHRTEGGLASNGKNAMAAVGLGLVDSELTRKASLHYALGSANSYRGLCLGHTGGGFDAIWRGIAVGSLPKEHLHKYRRHMDILRWFYDLSRRPKGGFGITAGTRYDNTHYGHGIALAYTAPLKTLRITGKPRGKFSQSYPVPKQLWGNKEDEKFLSIKHNPEFGEEKLPIHTVMNRLAAVRPLTDKASPKDPKDVAEQKAFLVRMLHHYHPFVRSQAAYGLKRIGALDELTAGLKHADPRVRRAALEGITNYVYWFLGPGRESVKKGELPPEMLAEIVKILQNPNEALYVTDAALLAMSLARPEEIEKHAALITPWLECKEWWWLRQTAWVALWGMKDDEQRLLKYLPAMFDYTIRETHIMPRRTAVYSYRAYLDKHSLQQPDSETSKRIVAGFIRALRQTPIPSGKKEEKIGAELTYELLRMYLHKHHDAAVETMEALAPRLKHFTPGFVALAYQGDSWGNFGILKAADKLPEAQRMKVYNLAKETLPLLEKYLQTTDDNLVAKSISMIKQATEPGWKWKPLVATSEKEGQSWRYLMWNTPEKATIKGEEDLTLKPEPPPSGMANWFAPGFDDSTWKTGKAPFGVGRVELPQMPAVANHTQWTTERILLRREFDLKQVEGILELRLPVLSREAVQVYLNGKGALPKGAPATKHGSNRPEYVPHELLYVPCVKQLKKGKNVIAISTYVTYVKGKPVGQIDAGLEVMRKSE